MLNTCILTLCFGWLRGCFEGESIDLWTGDGSDPSWIEMRL